MIIIDFVKGLAPNREHSSDSRGIRWERKKLKFGFPVMTWNASQNVVQIVEGTFKGELASSSST